MIALSKFKHTRNVACSILYALKSLFKIAKKRASFFFLDRE